MSPTSDDRARQFTLFRALFGVFLAAEFAHYSFYSDRLLGPEGAAVDLIAIPSGGLWSIAGWPWRIGFWSAAVLSVAIAVGLFRQWVAAAVLAFWALLHWRTAGISVPSHGFIGFFLLVLVVVPGGEPYSMIPKPTANWSLPPYVFAVAWLVVGVGYTLSGWDKLGSPSWVNGQALSHIFDGAVARPNGIVAWLAQLPNQWLTVGTYLALSWELLFLPLCVVQTTRRFIWWATLFFHLGILCTLQIGSVSIAMLIVQLFLFEGRPRERLRQKEVRATELKR